MSSALTVRLAHDREANVWYIADSNVLGLTGEAPTFEALLDRLPGLISDMIKENYPDTSILDESIDVTVSTCIQVAEAA